MADIFVSEFKDIGDPRLRGFAKRIFNEVQLAAMKAALHKRDPDRYPMPTGRNTLEALFTRRIDELPEYKQRFAGDRAEAAVTADPEIRKRWFHELADIDLTRAETVSTMADAIAPAGELRALPDTLELMSFNGHILERRPQPTVDARTMPELVVTDWARLVEVPTFIPWLYAQPQEYDSLVLKLKLVRLLDETNGFLGSEAGDDEISMGGSTVDWEGKVAKIPPFHVMDFNEGDSNKEIKVYDPAKTLHRFDLDAEGDWPRSFFATLVLAEVDNGGLPEFVDKIVKMLKTEVAKKLTELVTAGLGGAIGSLAGPIGAAVGAVVGWVIGKLFDWFKEWWNDDLFKPITLAVEVPNRTALFAGLTFTLPMPIFHSGHGGKYVSLTNWQLE